MIMIKTHTASLVKASDFTKSLHPFPIFLAKYTEMKGGSRLLLRTVANFHPEQVYTLY